MLLSSQGGFADGKLMGQDQLLLCCVFIKKKE